MADEKGVAATPQEDFSAWYADVIQKAELIEHTDVSGCMIIRPYAYAMWEKIQSFIQSRISQLGVQNAYFPLFIPEKLLTKEADHIEGFAPEVAWVTHGGSSKLSERLAIRPTSETIMYEAYSKWIRSHRDLPLKLNQWCNVVRWEFAHPTPFLRTREFLWQEGHTAHATSKEAAAEVEQVLDIYRACYEELLGVPVLAGEKSQKEKFAGADYTLSLETRFPNGKAIQACTSHFLGQSFAKAFGISFLDENEQSQHPFQNSWGFTTRSIGVMIGMHGDEQGLVLPPRIAPIPVVVVPIVFSNKPKASEAVMRHAKKLASESGWHLDDREGHSPGRKFAEWELKGVPVRIEIGPRDIENNVVTVVRRDSGEKKQVPLAKALLEVNKLLDDIQDSLFAKAKRSLDENIVDVASLDELKKVVEDGKFGRAPWCGTPESEEKIKAATGAKSLNSVSGKGTCFESGKGATRIFLFGRSY